MQKSGAWSKTSDKIAHHCYLLNSHNLSGGRAYLINSDNVIVIINNYVDYIN